MDPRESLLAVLCAAFKDGVADVNKRVDVFRIEPIWGDEELPLILIDFDDERVEERATAPRTYQHTLNFDVIIYAKGRQGKTRRSIWGLLRQVQGIMAEWQYIIASDVDPDCPPQLADKKIVDVIRAGDSVNYFKSVNGDQDHLAVRLAYRAEFTTSGSSTGEERRGFPSRNVLAEFREIFTAWPGGATEITQLGGDDEP